MGCSWRPPGTGSYRMNNFEASISLHANWMTRTSCRASFIAIVTVRDSTAKLPAQSVCCDRRNNHDPVATVHPLRRTNQPTSPSNPTIPVPPFRREEITSSRNVIAPEQSFVEVVGLQVPSMRRCAYVAMYTKNQVLKLVA